LIDSNICEWNAVFNVERQEVESMEGKIWAEIMGDMYLCKKE